MAVVVERFGVYLVLLDPIRGHEMGKTRPCLVVSPDEMNRHLRTVVVAPLTSRRDLYPSRVACKFRGKSGEVALDQIRTVDQQRLIKRVGDLEPATARTVLRILQEMFA